MSNEFSVITKGLRKVYNGSIEAVKGIDLEIKKGEIFGFLGPNGAGKSTTIKMLSTSIKPTSGEATVNGYDIIKESIKVRQSIGVVPQDLTADEDLKGIENLVMVGRFYGMQKEEAYRKSKELLEMVDLEEFGEKNVGSYSGGMRKRLELAMGLIHDPETIFLDEPTLGLDVQTRSKMWEYIDKIRKEFNVTILLTSHYLEEVDALSDRISIIDHGKIIVTGTSQELKDNLKGDIIQAEFKSKDDAMKFLNYENKIDGKLMNENTVRIKVESSETELPGIMDFIVKNNLKVGKFTVTKPSLDQVFLEYTGKELRDEEGGDARKMMINMRRLRR
ncbi:ATP-binding cassette domain-containing protein [Caldiplasma sukawensis]